MVMTEELKSHLVGGLDIAAIRRRVRSEGMATLRDDAWAKVQAGVTTVEEVLRVLE
jgi:type II secretory ATPase GspE/PulE/Tfp pilus assembly ATPase PilB-like protein